MPLVALSVTAAGKADQRAFNAWSKGSYDNDPHITRCKTPEDLAVQPASKHAGATKGGVLGLLMANKQRWEQRDVVHRVHRCRLKKSARLQAAVA